ncbi:tetratricopeptide repeat protein [Parafrankia sp. EUN1f]|uniref:tetratricopeptide repeat protein n=1 Tax=Parafrankia sp. EUN1f TaxID=102897 RepID=UPI002100EA60|nr:tetratricopeptide repeat protein [Parafrankia sp. EUN1f]
MGPDHPNTLTSRNNLASAYQAAGRVREAIDLFQQVLTDRAVGVKSTETVGCCLAGRRPAG